MIVKVSANNYDFTFRSNGESVAKEGHKFTSNNQGLYELSIIISNPNISKQLFMNGTQLLKLLNKWFSADSTVLIMISSI